MKNFSEYLNDKKSNASIERMVNVCLEHNINPFELLLEEIEKHHNLNQELLLEAMPFVSKAHDWWKDIKAKSDVEHRAAATKRKHKREKEARMHATEIIKDLHPELFNSPNEEAMEIMNRMQKRTPEASQKEVWERFKKKYKNQLDQYATEPNQKARELIDKEMQDILSGNKMQQNPQQRPQQRPQKNLSGEMANVAKKSSLALQQIRDYFKSEGIDIDNEINAILRKINNQPEPNVEMEPKEVEPKMQPSASRPEPRQPQPQSQSSRSEMEPVNF